MKRDHMIREGRTVPGHSGTEPEDKPCESIASLAHVQAVSDVPVSPAISLAISPSTSENYTTEEDGNQSSNQSGSKRIEKPNCYMCIHRRGLVGDAHSECVNPLISEADRLTSLLYPVMGFRSGAMNRMNISVNWHGVKNGWCLWPVNFDPVWLETCDAFEQ